MEESATLFVYGSLQYPEVLEALLGRTPRLTPARTAGWRVARLPDRVYPALVPGPDEARGLLICDLSHEEWRVIDEFEDEIYELRRLETLNGDEAWAYVCGDTNVALAEEWDSDLFATQELGTYVASCARWRRAL